MTGMLWIPPVSAPANGLSPGFQMPSRRLNSGDSAGWSVGLVRLRQVFVSPGAGLDGLRGLTWDWVVVEGDGSGAMLGCT
ncbi:MAG: hypothetical protein AB7O97_23155 [Planctomycetota bacterium]